MASFDPPADDSIVALGTRLATDARHLAQAEIALVKSRVAVRLAEAKQAAMLLVVALVLVLGAIGALLVGLILTLTPWLGAGGATATVTIGTLALAGILAWIGARRLGRVTGPADHLS